MFKRATCLAVAAAFAVALGGCASIVRSSQSEVNFNSTPPGAQVEVIDHNGQSVYSGVTPARVSLKTKRGYFKKAKYTVLMRKDGYQQVAQPLEASVRGWYFGNLGFGGLIGFLIIDPATGAMWKIDQKNVDANLPES